MALAVVSAALRDSIRLVDEAFRLEEDGDLRPRPEPDARSKGCRWRSGCCRSSTSSSGRGACGSRSRAGVVACPDHGADADQLLHKADAAMWRARAVGQPVGVGGLQDR